MGTVGIRKWSFTRRYDFGDGPWPSEDEATVTYDSEAKQVTVSGVFFDGVTNREGCARRVDYVPKDGALHVEVGMVRTGEQLALDVIQRIHYDVHVEFFDRLPEKTTVRHVSEHGDEQFSTTAVRDAP